MHLSETFIFVRIAMFTIDASDERRRRITLDEQPKLTGPASAFDFGEDFLIAEDNG